MVDIESETLFNWASAAVATLAVLIFVFNVDYPYSPVSKFGLVVAFLAGIFAVTQRADDSQLTLLGYGVVVVSTVALFFEVVSVFDLGNTATVLGLLAIAGVLFGLRTRLGEDSRFVAGSVASYAFGAVAALVVVVLLVDVVTGGLAYELQPESEVTFDGVDRGEEVQVASLVVTNPTPLPERVEAPRYDACAAGNWTEFRRPTEPGEPEHPVRVGVHVQDGYNEHVFSFGRESYPVSLHLDGTGIEGQTFPVEMTEECPDEETGEPYVALFQVPEDRPRGVAV